MECAPVGELHIRDRDDSELQIAVDGVDGELVLDEEVGDKNLILAAAWAPAGNLDHRCTFGRERIEDFASPAGTQEESPQDSRAGESEQPGVHAGDGFEPGGDLQHAHCDS